MHATMERFGTLLVTCLGSGVLLSLASPAALGERLEGTPYEVHGGSAQCTASGLNLNLTGVPVVHTGNGSTTYYNFSFKMNIDNGIQYSILDLMETPPAGPSPVQAGIYQDSNEVCYQIHSATPVEDDRVLYPITSTTEGIGCYEEASDFTATVVTGSPIDHPDIGSKDIVNSLSTTWVYGTVASPSQWTSGGITNSWRRGNLIGMRQSGDNVIFARFTSGNHSSNFQDHDTPQFTAVLRRVNPKP